MKGSVSYQKPNKAAKPIASQATIALADSDVTITGDDSLAAITLPDSSRVLVGSAAKVQLAFFNQSDIANAKFVIYQGKFRFNVEHPNGASANYTFQTPTAQIAVRGTEGDIGVDQDGTLRVNVYALSNPDLPVQVTTNDGKHFVLNAGQSLLAQFVNGVIQEQVNKLDDQIVDQFSPDFGVPSNWEQLKQTLVDTARSKLCSVSPIC
jgi:ferric-dicitrate binding protein FerR (iron transport regulator)